MSQSEFAMSGQGSTGNVVAAVCSFFLPGLGQLVQGRILAAIFMLLLTGAIWLFSFGLLGIIGHLIATIDAALYKPKD